jgi:hypothetical protein
MNSAKFSRVWVISGISSDFRACSKFWMSSSCWASVNSVQHDTKAALNKSLKINVWQIFQQNDLRRFRSLFFNLNRIFILSLTYWLIDWLLFNVKWASVYTVDCRVRVIVFSATFNTISAISHQSVLLVEETGVHGENHRPVACHWQTLSHKVASSTPRHEWGSNSQFYVMGTDCTGSFKSNYHMITTTISFNKVGIDYMCFEVYLARGL